jgi:flagellar basal-body rod modification protein FlgD
MEITGTTLDSTSTSSGIAAKSLSQDDFFTLLTAQLQAQDPLEPMNDQQFLSELANFSSLEQTSRVNDNLLGLAYLQESAATLQQLTQGATLIGSEVEYLDAATGETHSGRVQSVRLENGLVNLDLGDTKIPLATVTAVLGDGSAPTDDTSGEGDGEDA